MYQPGVSPLVMRLKICPPSEVVANQSSPQIGPDHTHYVVGHVLAEIGIAGELRLPVDAGPLRLYEFAYRLAHQFSSYCHAACEARFRRVVHRETRAGSAQDRTGIHAIRQYMNGVRYLR